MLKKLARIEASSIELTVYQRVRQKVLVHTHQLEFVNTSLPTLVCRVHWLSGASTVTLFLSLVSRSALDSKALQTFHQGRKFQKSPSLSKEVSFAVAGRLPRL